MAPSWLREPDELYQTTKWSADPDTKQYKQQLKEQTFCVQFYANNRRKLSRAFAFATAKRLAPEIVKQSDYRNLNNRDVVRVFEEGRVWWPSKLIETTGRELTPDVRERLRKFEVWFAYYYPDGYAPAPGQPRLSLDDMGLVDGEGLRMSLHTHTLWQLVTMWGEQADTSYRMQHLGTTGPNGWMRHLFRLLHRVLCVHACPSSRAIWCVKKLSLVHHPGKRSSHSDDAREQRQKRSDELFRIMVVKGEITPEGEPEERFFPKTQHSSPPREESPDPTSPSFDGELLLPARTEQAEAEQAEAEQAESAETESAGGKESELEEELEEPFHFPGASASAALAETKAALAETKAALAQEGRERRARAAKDAKKISALADQVADLANQVAALAKEQRETQRQLVDSGRASPCLLPPSPTSIDSSTPPAKRPRAEPLEDAARNVAGRTSEPRIVHRKACDVDCDKELRVSTTPFLDFMTGQFGNAMYTFVKGASGELTLSDCLGPWDVDMIFMDAKRLDDATVAIHSESKSDCMRDSVRTAAAQLKDGRNSNELLKLCQCSRLFSVAAYPSCPPAGVFDYHHVHSEGKDNLWWPPADGDDRAPNLHWISKVGKLLENPQWRPTTATAASDGMSMRVQTVG